jgi:hypothetical protein
VQAIRAHHPDVKILIVDSDSADKSYFDLLTPYNVIIADIANQNYESGAFWYAVENYKEDWYVLLQDSMILNKSIANVIASPTEFTCFMYFTEDSHNNYTHLNTSEWIGGINRMLGTLTPISTEQNTTYTGVFGPNFIIKSTLVDKLLANNLDKTLRPTNKYEHQMSERVWGLAVSQHEIDLTKSSILGDFHIVREGKYKAETNTLYTEYFIKQWFNSKRT